MTLNKKIVLLLKRKKLKIAVAESCTGGMLSSAITAVSGASKVFIMGLVTYSNEAKIRILKVPRKIIQKQGAVSIKCCLSMVNNLSKISNSPICISITGIAGPKGGTKEKPVGLVNSGIKNKKKTIINKSIFKNNGRSSIRRATVKKTLNLLSKILK